MNVGVVLCKLLAKSVMTRERLFVSWGNLQLLVTDDESTYIGYLSSTLITNTIYEIYDIRVMVMQGKVVTYVQAKVCKKIELFTGDRSEIKI